MPEHAERSLRDSAPTLVPLDLDQVLEQVSDLGHGDRTLHQATGVLYVHVTIHLSYLKIHSGHVDNFLTLCDKMHTNTG